MRAQLRDTLDLLEDYRKVIPRETLFHCQEEQRRYVDIIRGYGKHSLTNERLRAERKAIQELHSRKRENRRTVFNR